MSRRAWFGSTREHAQSGSCRTPPGAGDKPRPLTLVVGADLGGQGRCRNAAAGGYSFFQQITRLHPDGFVANGDVVYADNTCPAAGPAWTNIPGDFPSDLDVDWTDVAATRDRQLRQRFGHVASEHTNHPRQLTAGEHGKIRLQTGCCRRQAFRR